MLASWACNQDSWWASPPSFPAKTDTVGHPVSQSVVIPPSLKRRARLVATYVNATLPEMDRTQIQLRLGPGQRWNQRI